jgi:Ca2+-binding RTX toxin-like protein
MTMTSRNSFRPELRSLEAREVPAAISLTNGVLRMSGDGKIDTYDHGIVRVQSNLVVAVMLEREVDNTIVGRKVAVFNPAQVKSVLFNGKAGDDVLVNKTAIASVGYGANGNDRLYGGTGIDTFYGGNGNDTLAGRGGNSTLIGGAGNDALYGSTNGFNYLSGGDGDDFLYGGEGTDYLYAGAGTDYLYGYGGSDSLHGDAGNDFLHGGAGNDTLLGGTGVDYLEGNAGADRLNGGQDGVADTLWGGTEKDVFVLYYRSSFLGIRTGYEEGARDYEGILGSWDRTEEYQI